MGQLVGGGRGTSLEQNDTDRQTVQDAVCTCRQEEGEGVSCARRGWTVGLILHIHSTVCLSLSLLLASVL